ncbi:MAG: hypothetical protein H7843_05310 [Nitrospirota bacterium]
MKKRFLPIIKPILKIVLLLGFAVILPLYARATSTYTLYIAVSGTGGGTITPSSGTITWSGSTGTTTGTIDDTVYYYVQPSLGSSFQSWSGCDSVSDNGTCAYTFSSDNKTLTLTYGGSSTYVLTVKKTGFGSGTIVPSVGSITWSSTTGTATYNSNQSIALYPVADNASRFFFWQDCDSVSDNGTCSITLRSNATLKARFSGYHNVTYGFPYLHTSSSAVVYCMIANFSTDKATADGLVVLSNAQQTATQIPYELPSTFTIPKGRTAMLTFSKQRVYSKLQDNSTASDNGTISDNTSLNIANDTCVDCSYGARISWTSALATMTSGVDCLSLPMACFQGTTLPKRNMVGYYCSDDSTTGPGGKPNLIGY